MCPYSRMRIIMKSRPSGEMCPSLKSTERHSENCIIIKLWTSLIWLTLSADKRLQVIVATSWRGLVFCLTRLLLTLVSPPFTKTNTRLSSHLSSWSLQSCTRLASSTTLRRTCIRLRAPMTTTKITYTSLPHLSNPSLQCTEKSSSNLRNCLSDTLETPHVSVRRLVPMVEMCGVSSESISSRKLSSLCCAPQTNLGKSLTKWLTLLKSSIRLLSFLIKLSRLFLALLMMPLPRSMISKPGSPATRHIESLFHAPTALTTSHALWRSDMPWRTWRRARLLPSCTCLMEHSAPLREPYAA